MRRRELVSLLGGLAAISLTARAPAGGNARGWLPRACTRPTRGNPAPLRFVGAFKNPAICWPRTLRSNTTGPSEQIDRLPAMAADLVKRRVTVVPPGLCAGGTRRTSGNHHNSNRLRNGERGSPAWSHRQPKPAGRQRNRRVQFDRREVGPKTVGIVA